MLRRGTKAAAFYRGNGLPAQLYHGTQLIAGYHDYTQQAMGEWEWSYNDHVAVTVTGKGKQNGTPTPSVPVPLIGSQSTLTSSNRGGTHTSTVALPILRAIPGRENRDTAEYIGGGEWKITRSVGVLEVDGKTVKFSATADGGYWNLPQRIAPGVQLGAIANTIGIPLAANLKFEFLFTRPTFAGMSEFDSADALNARCAELYEAGTPMTIWYQRTAVEETLVLGELATYPCYTLLTVSGDYVPDITATAKVAD